MASRLNGGDSLSGTAAAAATASGWTSGAAGLFGVCEQAAARRTAAARVTDVTRITGSPLFGQFRAHPRTRARAEQPVREKTRNCGASVLIGLQRSGYNRCPAEVVMSPPADVTALLLAWNRGDEDARSALMTAGYAELRRMAARRRRR